MLLLVKTSILPHIKSQLNTRTIFILGISNLLVVLLYYFVIMARTASCSPSSLLPSFVITLSEHDPRVSTVVALFKKYANLNLCVYYGINGNTLYTSEEGHSLTPGERGLRDTMNTFFEMVLRNSYEEVMIFDDDAIPHLNFTTLFNQLPNRCRQADVLLLGATVCHGSRDKWPPGACFDADTRTYGSFALLVKKKGFLPILEWLALGEEAPFDIVYTYLQKQGLSVRVAYPPFLAIPDVSHPSLVNKYRVIDRYTIQQRAAMHDWHLGNYPMFVIPM